MITRISGQVDSVSENSVQLRVGGMTYDVWIPTAVMKSFNGQLTKDSELTLITYHYYHTDPSKSIPVLIGFANTMEKDFFEKFITVSGVGPKAALKALKEPISAIAAAIDGADIAFLRSLPGIGEQRAKEIIAKLQGKMGRFGLIRSSVPGAKGAPAGTSDLSEEAFEVLLQLQYKKEEARQMIQKAFSRKPDLSSVEEILNEVYRQRKTVS